MLAATTRAYLQGAMSYVDNGDGYYLYAAQRLAGVLAALALFTKNLYAPLLVATLAYLAVRRRPLLVPYLQGLVVGLGALSAMLAVYAGPAGLHDAFLGQQSSPFNPAWFVVS